MAVWLIRGGSDGEFEAKFLQENRVYVTWDTLDVDLLKMKDRSELVDALALVRTPREDFPPRSHCRGAHPAVTFVPGLRTAAGSTAAQPEYRFQPPTGPRHLRMPLPELPPELPRRQRSWGLITLFSVVAVLFVAVLGGSGWMLYRHVLPKQTPSDSLVAMIPKRSETEPAKHDETASSNIVNKTLYGLEAAAVLKNDANHGPQIGREEVALSLLPSCVRDLRKVLAQIPPLRGAGTTERPPCG